MSTLLFNLLSLIIYRFWHHFQLVLLCLWFTLLLFLSLELVSTLLEALELLSYTTITRHGITMYASLSIIYFNFCYIYFLEYKIINVGCVCVVDILGWTLYWCCHCCNLPPVCVESTSGKGFGFFQEFFKPLKQ